MYLYIHPVLNEANFFRKKLIEEFISFHSFFQSKSTLLHGLFILIVRTTDHTSQILEKAYESSTIKVYILYTHKDFMDGGEIFMQNNNETETKTLIDLVRTMSEIEI